MRNSGQPFCAVCQGRIRNTLRFYAPGEKRPMDYTVVTSTRNHFDQASELPGTFVGKSKDFVFYCPCRRLVASGSFLATAYPVGSAAYEGYQGSMICS